ncbi:MAG TPA: DUF2244 domain-containing protein [Burkholderiales bacterium]|nr:DUF2244 domain-containing protein [Burkholderiales bacterium]
MLIAERATENPRRAKGAGRQRAAEVQCSISPAALATVFALLALATLAIGVAFAAFGAWLVLPFAGLEALLLAGAFLATARRNENLTKKG